MLHSLLYISKWKVLSLSIKYTEVVDVGYSVHSLVLHRLAIPGIHQLNDHEKAPHCLQRVQIVRYGFCRFWGNCSAFRRHFGPEMFPFLPLTVSRFNFPSCLGLSLLCLLPSDEAGYPAHTEYLVFFLI